MLSPARTPLLFLARFQHENPDVNLTCLTAHMPLDRQPFNLAVITKHDTVERVKDGLGEIVHIRAAPALSRNTSSTPTGSSVTVACARIIAARAAA